MQACLPVAERRRNSTHSSAVIGAAVPVGVLCSMKYDTYTTYDTLWPPLLLVGAGMRRSRAAA